MKDDKRDVYGESGAGKENADDAPTEQIAVVGQSRRVAGEGLRRSWGQVGLAGTSTTGFSTSGEASKRWRA